MPYPVPPLLLGLTLLFWGWQDDHPGYALTMAILLEAASVVRLRFEIETTEFNRIADLSSLIFILVALYQFNERGMSGIFAILGWLPVVFFPLLFIQKYSLLGRVPLPALFYSMRKQATAGLAAPVDLGYPYLLLCLLAASAGNQRGMIFFACASALLLLALWPLRSRRYTRVTWVLAVLLAAALGYALQSGAQTAQRELEQMLLGLFDEYFWQHADPDRSVTAIGSLGRLKLSDHIRIRVSSEKPLSRPLYLLEASYDQFNLGIWKARENRFQALDPAPGQPRRWLVGGDATTTEGSDELRISTRLRKGLSVIPLPQGLREFRLPEAVEFRRNPLGTSMLEIRPGLVTYLVRYRADADLGTPPGVGDLEVPISYREALSRIDRDLGLTAGVPDPATLLQAFFQRNFRYSLVRRGHYPGLTPLIDFLTRQRQGHCEYFASATVLLLRQAGIPARYAIGYSVREYSPLEGRYVVRDRHAHAWARAWLDGRWQTIDTTPPDWSVLEDAATGHSTLADLWSWLRFSLARWRGQGMRTGSPELWLLPPLSLWLAWRLYRRRHRRRSRSGDDDTTPDLRPGRDSEFYRLVQALERQGHHLLEGEALQAWVQRYPGAREDEPLGHELGKLLDLHYRYRFDPRGLSEGQQRRLASGSRALLRRLGPRDPHDKP